MARICDATFSRTQAPQESYFHAVVTGTVARESRQTGFENFDRFTTAVSQDIVFSGWNHPTHDLSGDCVGKGLKPCFRTTSWRTKCRKLSSLLLCSPSWLPALPRRNRLRLRLRSRPSPTTPASTSDLARGRRVSVAPGNPDRGDQRGTGLAGALRASAHPPGRAGRFPENAICNGFSVLRALRHGPALLRPCLAPCDLTRAAQEAKTC